MGKPPLGRSTQGRANPIGISYLYVTSDIKTAISEIRPHKGALVTVAKIKLPDNLKFFQILEAPKILFLLSLFQIMCLKLYIKI